MSERKINLEEIIFNHCENEFMDGLVTFHKDQLIKSYLEFGKQLLELASQNAECKLKIKIECNKSQLENGFVFGTNAIIINKQSILDTIKQVE